MRLSLEKITVTNFKGIRSLALDFADTETHIFGMNGSGKSSIADAFCWVLYNKDSHGNAPGSDNFREKPLDDTGHEIHNLDTTVELDCRLDGKAFNLRRTQRENWVKKRGSANPVFSGNVSTYWINDVETALKDFKARIAEIAPEEVFRLIGNLAAFNAQEWKKRREQLLALSGSDVDDKLLATDEYRALADECGQRNISIDELKKVLADQRKRTNTELQMLPVRIDEARKALPEISANELSDAEFVVKDNTATIQRIDAMIAETKASANASSITSQVVALEQEISSITHQISAEWSDGKRALERRKTEADDDLRRWIERKGSAEMRTNQLKGQLERATEQRNSLRQEYMSAKSEHFTWVEGAQICPTCGQPMPAAKLQEARDAAETMFNADKKNRLEDIARRGSDAAKEVERLTAMLAESDTETASAAAQIADAQERRNAVGTELTAYPQTPDYDNPRVLELRRQVAELHAQQSQAPDDKVESLMQRKAELQMQIDAKRAVFAKRDAAAATEARIKELEANQKEKGAELAELEQLIALTEKFIADRCAALEESINACFPTIRWKLFETQINGGITDVCNCMIPCESGLVAYESANTAAQVNADLEIINVLSRHYDVYIPLFVDGAESVNTLAHTDSQLITLSVSRDEELTIKGAA